ncbi:MAG: DUF2950 domain-containing protein [Thermodesulfovibrionales bacterium]|nr:DUF2950 domain-containing protein [Thermodesulfovibrionales bacterium]
MLPEMNNKERSAHYLLLTFAAAVMVMIVTIAGMTADAATKQKGFASAEEAVKAFIAAIKADDNKEVLAIFGSESKEVISSGDPVGDKQRRAKFIKDYDQKNALAKDGDKMVLSVGERDWPFPIPLVKKGDQWVFDTKAGKEEILNRRIGENELDTIQTMLAIVDAQREYAMKDLDGDGILEYAEKFRSDAGKKNGLHWEAKEGEEPSPIGELVAGARTEGYIKAGTKDNPSPFHGYYFRMLKEQGKYAPGGAFDYVVKGNQIGGFAVVAYPAKFGNSGVMTFVVNHDGVVYQKDLGKNTEKIAKAMTKYDPDKTWGKAQ